MSDYAVWLDRATDAHRLGPKMGRLVELAAAGLTVPRGFVVTVAAQQAHCAAIGLRDRADAVLAGAVPDVAELEPVARELRSACEAAPVPEPVRAAVVAAYDELADRCIQVNTPVAVRSSAAGEDGADVSFAGAFDTYLGVSGAERVVSAIRACWGSVYTPRALAQLLRRGEHDMPMAVGVIELVSARSSGVAFSAHPVTGRADRIVIEANWGWGEAVVQGHVTPDHLEIDKADRRVLRHDVAIKRVVSAFDFEAGRVREMPMPERLRGRRVLDGEEVERIVEAVTCIEAHYGAPVDVEWVIDRGRRPGEAVTVVQARPVTTPTAEPRAWNPADYAARYAFGDTF